MVSKSSLQDQKGHFRKRLGYFWISCSRARGGGRSSRGSLQPTQSSCACLGQRWQALHYGLSWCAGGCAGRPGRTGPFWRQDRNGLKGHGGGRGSRARAFCRRGGLRTTFSFKPSWSYPCPPAFSNTPFSSPGISSSYVPTWFSWVYVSRGSPGGRKFCPFCQFSLTSSHFK